MNQARRASLAFILIASTGVCCFAADASVTSRPVAADAADAWPMWGSKPDRNMVSAAKGLPTEWDVKTRKNIKWVAELGTQTFSNPVVSGGKVLIGTNNGRPRNAEVRGDKGVLMCFAEKDGEFLWQAVHDKLAAGDNQDWADIGITSTPCVVGDRVYYVSNRCELVCADLEGFRDGQNDGAIQDEKLHGKADADFVWILDMMGQLGVTPHFASASAPLVVGDLVFVVTGNGIDEDKGKPANPAAPSFIAVRRDSGKVVWADHSPADAIIAGQWSSPAYGVVKGEPQVVFPGGDGWLYAFKPATGELIWKFNCLAHEAKADAEATKDQLVATPVIFQDRVIIAVGQDPEQGDGEGCLRAIDATGHGDVTASAEVWRLSGEDFGRSVSTVAVDDGLVYAAELGGFLDCIDWASGKRCWRHDLKAGTWSSPLVADGKVWLANDDGDVMIFKAGKSDRPPTVNHLASSTHGTPAITHGVVYVADRTHLYAIGK